MHRPLNYFSSDSSKEMATIISPPSSPLFISSGYLQIHFDDDSIICFEMHQVNGDPWTSMIPSSVEDKKNRFLGTGNHACVYKSCPLSMLGVFDDCATSIFPSTNSIAVKVFHKEESDALYSSFREFYYQSESYHSAPHAILKPIGILIRYNNIYSFVTKIDPTFIDVYSRLLSISEIRYTQVALLMEHGQMGSLAAIPRSLITKELIIAMVYQLGHILKALSSQGLVHGDIKPHNLFPFFMDEKFHLKLGDFSSTIRITSSSSSQTSSIGTQPYLAPDLLSTSTPSIDAILGGDIYSAGVSLYTLITGIAPFEGISSSIHRFIAIKKGFFACGQNPWIYTSVDANAISIRLPSGEDLSPELSATLINLVEMMLQKDTNNRPTPDILLAMFNGH